MNKLGYVLGAILIAALCVLVSSCSNQSNNTSREASPEASPPMITADQAVDIAKKKMSSEADINMLDIRVLENRNSWTVDFPPKEQYKHLYGGGGAVEVDKRTGEVLRFYVGK